MNFRVLWPKAITTDDLKLLYRAFGPENLEIEQYDPDDRQAWDVSRLIFANPEFLVFTPMAARALLRRQSDLSP